VPGGAPGLQNQWGGVLLRLVGSIPTHSRHNKVVSHGLARQWDFLFRRINMPHDLVKCFAINCLDLANLDLQS